MSMDDLVHALTETNLEATVQGLLQRPVQSVNLVQQLIHVMIEQLKSVFGFRNEGPTGDGSPWTDPRFVGEPVFIVRQTSADCLLVRIHLYTSLLARLVATINGQPSEALDAAICGALMHHLAGGLALVPWVAALIVGLVARHALSWSGALRLLLLPLLESAFSAAVCNHLRTRSSFFSARAGP